MEKTEYMESKSFSLSRFTSLLRSDIIVNRSHYLTLALATIGCFAAVAIFASINEVNISNEFNSADSRNVTVVMMSFFLTVLFSLGLTVFGSLTFSSMSSKSSRISTLMQPASLSEKFLLRAFIYDICGLILLVVGVIVAILISQLAFGGGKILMNILDEVMELKQTPYLVCMAGLSFLSSNAMYVLGSALWPKLSWLKTWLVSMALQWIFSLIFMTAIFSGLNMNFVEKIIKSPESVFWFITACQVIIIIAFWWAAWWRFRTTQIIQKFMKK
ncbi:MAG: hypothetical protein HDS32_01210 [Bacteroides sp.]|nr:hypothetical protein [Bacteroides sp.]